MEKKNEGKSFLWEVISKKGKKVYIMGSIHVGSREMYPLKAPVIRAFKESKYLAVEVDIFNINILETFKMTASLLYPENETLKDHITEETFTRLKDTFKKHGADINQFINYRAWVVAMYLTGLTQPNFKYSKRMGVDKYFLDRARRNKKVIELETAEFQLSIMNGMTDRQQDAYLRSVLDGGPNAIKYLDDIVKMWIKGDHKTFHKIQKGVAEKYPELIPFYDKLIYERNEFMVINIEDFFKEAHTFFVVVGAGHLTGKRGIISLLAKKGYQVNQL